MFRKSFKFYKDFSPQSKMKILKGKLKSFSFLVKFNFFLFKILISHIGHILNWQKKIWLLSVMTFAIELIFFRNYNYIWQKYIFSKNRIIWQPLNYLINVIFNKSWVWLYRQRKWINKYETEYSLCISLFLQSRL